jgi:L-alanine-DL-glutamate epimerase-like enolase superfamily enzyme
MLDCVRLDRLAVPLSSPYRLSTVTVEALDVVLVRVETDDGRRGAGEVTTLEGYSAETGDEAWANLTAVAPDLPGRSLDAACERVASALDDRPFSASGLVAALETAGGVRVEPTTAPIVGILSADDPPGERRDSLYRQLDAGFETVKVKVGFDPQADADAVRDAVADAPDHVSFRVDANQGYTRAEAERFLDHAPVDRLAYLEQPLPVGDLDAHATLRGYSDLDILLDEEVETPADVARVEDAGAADGVKFKFMKCGGVGRTVAAIEDALNRGFTVSFGNGVQSDVGCVLEALVWAATDLETAGEFNGWRKQAEGVLQGGLAFADGSLRWTGDALELDEAVLDRYRVDAVRYGGP